MLSTDYNNHQHLTHDLKATRNTNGSNKKKTNLATDQRTKAKQVRQAFTLLHNNSTVDSDNKFC